MYYQKASFGRMFKLIKASFQKKDITSLSKEGIEPYDKSKHGFARVGDRRFREYRLDQGDTNYVLGTATPKGKNVIIQQGEGEKTFIISQQSQKQKVKSYKIKMVVSWIFSILLIVGGILLWIGA